MAGRIFPRTRKEEIEQNPAILSTINLEEVDRRIKEAQGIAVSKEEQPVVKTAAKKTPSRNRVKKQPEVREICATCGVERPCSCDITEAEARGDNVRVAEILQIREARRGRAIQAIDEKEALDFRTAVRDDLEKLIAKASESMEKDAEDAEDAENTEDAEDAENDEDTKKTKDAKDTDEKISESVDAEDEKEASVNKKETVEKYAQKMGWPKEWVSAMFENAEAQNIPSSIKMVLDNNDIKEEQKKKLVVSMVKDANLSEDQKNRVVLYWEQELGYPSDWAKLLVEDPE